MSEIRWRIVLAANLCFLASAIGLFAQSSVSSGEVSCRTNTTLYRTGGDWAPPAGEMKMSHDIIVSTNGTFTVNGGKARELREGQILRADGYMLDADGSILPVYDHVAMIGGGVKVYRDGEQQGLSTVLRLSDGSVIQQDGSYTRPDSRRSRLVDGQLLTMDGTVIPGLDTITYRKGIVTVFRSGSFITLSSPSQMMGMYDGSRVKSDGTLIALDGSTTSLKDGQTVTVDGVRADW